MNTKNTTFSFKRIAGFFMFALLSVVILQSCNKEDFTKYKTAKYKEFNQEQKKLWSEHMQYTYPTVDAFFHNADALGSNLNRLLANQNHIGASIVPYYGQEAGDKLAALLTEYIELAVPVLTAAKDGDEAGLTTALNNWYANAQEIGDFLSAVNPEHWKQDDMRHMMKMHIDQTVGYSVLLLQDNYTDALVKYQEAFDHMQDMADHISEGIASQFPKNFKK
jgi:hypothetical protein